jgi:hypothetical protein
VVIGSGPAPGSASGLAGSGYVYRGRLARTDEIRCTSLKGHELKGPRRAHLVCNAFESGSSRDVVARPRSAISGSGEPWIVHEFFDEAPRFVADGNVLPSDDDDWIKPSNLRSGAFNDARFLKKR